MFWGGREGYQTLLNTDMERELDHMVNFSLKINFLIVEKNRYNVEIIFFVGTVF